MAWGWGLPVSWCRWKPRWSVVLSGLGLGWVFATSVTAFGMYMIACNTSMSVHVFVTQNEKGQEEGMPTLQEFHPGLVVSVRGGRDTLLCLFWFDCHSEGFIKHMVKILHDRVMMSPMWGSHGIQKCCLPNLLGLFVKLLFPSFLL